MGLIMKFFDWKECVIVKGGIVIIDCLVIIDGS